MTKLLSRWLSRLGVFAVYIAVLGLISLYGILVLLGYDEEMPTDSKLAIDADVCTYACREARSEPAQMRLLEQSSQPIAYVVGSSQGAKVIKPGQCVCIRAVVPALPLGIVAPETIESSNQTDPAAYRPVAGWPVDSLMVDLVMQSSKDNNNDDDPLYLNAHVTVSVHMLSVTQNLDYTALHVYEGTAQLFDPGLYAIDARIEFRNGQWNAEPNQRMPAYQETPMRTSLPSNVLVQSQVLVQRDTKHPTYLRRHQDLRLCTDNAAVGRWIPKANLPATWKAWQFMIPAEDGRVWVPYHCRLRRISYAEFVFHMSMTRPSMHWYGDSNSRRTLRPFILGGKWCHEANSSTRMDCLCNDAPKDLYPSTWYDAMPVPYWYRIHNSGVFSSEVYADLRLQAQLPTDPRPILDKYPSDTRFGPDYVPPGYRLRNDYFDLYYRFTRGTLDTHGSHWERDITHAAIAPYRPANLVVFQMITWDVAFGSYNAFARDTLRLARRLRAVYPNAEFVYRSGPYWCCRNAEDQSKRHSRLRFMAFDMHARKVFQRELKARVWDTVGPASQRPPASKRNPENLPCHSAHSRSELIHLDNQIFMNMLVND